MSPRPWSGPSRSGLRVLPEFVAHDAADLAEARPHLERGAHRREQVVGARAGAAQVLERPVDGRLVAVRLELLQAVDLLALRLRVDPEDLDLVDRVGDVLVDTHD